MPAVRLSSSRRGSAVGRRRSSLAAVYAKPGTYGYTPPPTSPQSAVTFAPNVTPVTYEAPSPTPSPFGSPSLTTDLPLPLFPPSATPAPPPTRRRVPPGKRRSQGYVPRPPNAFMLFRADFVRQKHVPGSIETNHGSLSKIIGNCWRALPLAEKHIWEVKAKHAKAEHKLKYPDYKFRPVHNKKGAAPAPLVKAPNVSAKNQLSPQEDERRCEEVAALLLQGKKGEELAWAVRNLDTRRKVELVDQSPSPDLYQQQPPNSKFPHPLNLDPMYYPAPSPPASSLASSGSPYTLPMPLDDGRDQTWRRHRRSSSVPLPNDYSYTFPPFMYNESHAGNGITLPPLGFPTTSGGGFTLPPPPSSSEDSLAGMPMGISGPARMSFSWAAAAGNAPITSTTGTGSSFSYPRPSFSFGFGAGARGSFSLAGAFGGAGAWAGPMGGRRASSAQAFFSPTAFKFPDDAHAQHAQMEYQQQQQQAEEELPDADTSLFDSGFLNSFGASANAAAGSPVSSEGVSPFDGADHQQQRQILHAPQPVHAVSPMGVEFAEQQQQSQVAYNASVGYAEYPANGVYGSHGSTPVSVSAYPTDEVATSQLPAAEEEYPPFEFAPENQPLGFESRLRTSIDMTADVATSSSSAAAAAGYDYDYSSEFV